MVHTARDDEESFFLAHIHQADVSAFTPDVAAAATDETSDDLPHSIVS